MLYELKKKALHLIDESMTSGGGIEYLKKLNAFFDMAQKQLALVAPIVRVRSVQSQDGFIKKQPDMQRITRVLNAERLSVPLIFFGEDVRVEKGGEFLVEYFAYPKTIDEKTPDSYVLEICPEAQEAAAFFAAALCVMEDEPQLYAFLMALYNERLYNIQKKDAPVARVRGPRHAL